MTAPTSRFTAFALEPFPNIKPGDDLARAITDTSVRTGNELRDGDIVVIASKVVSIAENRYVDLSSVTPAVQAMKLSAQTGKPATIVQLILDNSTDHYLATKRGPIIANHKLGYQLTSAGVDRAGNNGAWLLPANPDASARALRNAIAGHTGTTPAVIIADSDGRPDRRGATVISIGAAGINPLRTTQYTEKQQEETITDLVAAAAGIILGQRGRGVPVAILRGVSYTASDEGIAAILHRSKVRSPLSD